MYPWIEEKSTLNGYSYLIRSSLRHLIIHIIFLSITSIVVLGNRTYLMHKFSNVLEKRVVSTEYDCGDEHFTDFQNIRTVAELWKFLEAVLDEITDNFNDTNTKPHTMHENFLLGVPRLRQLRVRNNSCEIHPDFKTLFVNCYDDFSKNSEDKSEFGETDRWIYKSEKELGESSYHGFITTYHGGGFIQDLDVNSEERRQTLLNLQNQTWITRKTRVVFLDFTVYNPNLNLFCIMKLVFELPSTGNVVTSYEFYTVNLLRYYTSYEYFLLGCKIIFLGFLFYYTIEKIFGLWYSKWAYFKNIWNIVDLSVVLICYCCTAFSIYSFIVLRSKIDHNTTNPKQFNNLAYFGRWHYLYKDTSAVILFILWIKLFKYMNLTRTMGQLSSTLSRCKWDIVGFSFMFGVMFLAFAEVGFLIFGAQVEKFSSFGYSILTLLMTILGDFDYYEIESQNHIMAPIFFTTYIFFVFFVLLNMFLAIITDTYSDVKFEMDIKRNELDIVELMKRASINLKSKFMKSQPKKTSPKLGSDIFENMREILNICKFSETEIEILLSVYTNEADFDEREIDGYELLKKLQKHTTDENTHQETHESKLKLLESYYSDMKKIDSLQKQLRVLDSKIDNFINMLEEK